MRPAALGLLGLLAAAALAPAVSRAQQPPAPAARPETTQATSPQTAPPQPGPPQAAPPHPLPPQAAPPQSPPPQAAPPHPLPPQAAPGAPAQAGARAEGGRPAAGQRLKRRISYAACNRAALRRNLRGGARRRFLIRCRLGYERIQPGTPPRGAEGRPRS
ncbi:hypothetical protein M446_6368 [Methylobacterium sp. 4-46]|uniref:hypothetical protein n=1 Tax=Methylobacterium sp. (strain 4-46) TaxID=426117 RepID=UPI000165CC66|nr:hypothetical protein [Methylobacterium sp. 4-46]ACA20632.1 hypothetical protein M446_6368 [Methylobacterium sp. 4-46]